MTNELEAKSWIVYVGTFPPRECGIATFTQDLSNSFDKLFGKRVESKIVAMNAGEKIKYGGKVIYEIAEQKLEDYKKAAEYLNSLKRVKVVNIQHEFGIFGGTWGNYLLEFLKAIKKPVVVTLHTVLPTPDDELKNLVKDISNLSQYLVVMTQTSLDILTKDYGIASNMIKIVPHGLHAVLFDDPDNHKAKLDLKDKFVIATFGLLNKNKGIEYVLDALPQVVKKFPKLKYLIVGATHPTVFKKEGEIYRNSLIEKIHKLNLEDNVVFINKYLTLPELLEVLKSIDVYMATPLDPHQAVSGTLTYALGVGRPVIATAFAQARELVTQRVGRVVPMRSSKHITESLLELLGNKQTRFELSRNAYFVTRPMVWENVALVYMQLYSYLVPEIRAEQKNLPGIKLKHLAQMTDEFGMFQFATLSAPDPRWGYTVDDNARALIVLCLYLENHQIDKKIEKLAKVYLEFICFVSRNDGYFDNYVTADKILDEHSNRNENLQDASARTLLALATAATSKLPVSLKDKAQKLFEQSLNKQIRFTSLRSSAFYTKALALWVKEYNSVLARNSLRTHARFIVDEYEQNATSDWAWFENVLAYCNGIIPEALLYAYSILNEVKFFAIGKAALDFLIAQTFLGHIYVPIGQNGWYRKGANRALYDQQPEDPCAMVLALKSMHDITGEKKYAILMHRAFYWFLGNNLLHQFMYDDLSGGCFDGLEETSINFNEGAESTVSYLTARLTLQLDPFHKRVRTFEHASASVAQPPIQ